MTEQDRPKPSAEQEPWDTAAIASALGAVAEPRVDQLHGQGVRYRVGEPPGTELELFPATGTVRVTSADLRLSLFRQEAPTLGSDGVIFARPRRSLAIASTGALILNIAALKAAEDPTMPQDAPISAKRAFNRLPDDETPSDDPATPQTPSPASPEQHPKGIHVVGRLVRIDFHETKTGKLVGELLLEAPHPNIPGQFTTLKFAGFGPIAEVMREELTPGEMISAIGIPHDITRRDRAGREWVERQHYLVRPPKLRGRGEPEAGR